jgi:hypothetical protein
MIITVAIIIITIIIIITQVGGLYGILEAVENLSGLVGPTLGGILFRMHPQLPIATVVAIYLVVFIIVWLYYSKYIVSYTHHHHHHHKTDVDKED